MSTFWLRWRRPIIAFSFGVSMIMILAICMKTSLDKSSGNINPPTLDPQDIVTKKKYSEALSVALKFFDVQKSGKLMNDMIPWRGDSALSDGKYEMLDLSKGMYDAGDHVKFGFPMAFTATVLSWAILEYHSNMILVGELINTRDALKWITDYLVNANPRKNVLFVQVGDPKIDHKCWERPEEMTEERPLLQINQTFPGTEVAAETAAALAAASIVFRRGDPSYSTLLLKHSESLFSFADGFKGSYSINIPQVQPYYNSSGYTDELLWAAVWLYHATGKDSYLQYATVKHRKSFADWGRSTWFSWDDKLAGTQVLLSRTSFLNEDGVYTIEETEGLQKYRESAELMVCNFLPDSPIASDSRTKEGLLWIQENGSLQHSVSASFITLLFSDYMKTSKTDSIKCHDKYFTSEDIRRFAKSQADYILGNNTMQLSYLVGYTENYPKQVHHRGASIPAEVKTGCKGYKWFTSEEPNPNVAVGALVGGPFKNDSYIDFRNNSMQAEPKTYNTAALVGLLSGLVHPLSATPGF
ncbi:endo-beta-1,4-glucanase, family GH9 [Zostera marina]|uniref:cellulase n=1 Tax=Zostera marina TaxID=29655 RepID=A0A0K9P6X2_ZOSMR|nr:endo-beta-1,4-glucanase, family GH9 [Zostera marina]